MVILHSQLWNVYVCNAPSTTAIFLEHEMGLLNEWKTNEFMNEWATSFSKSHQDRGQLGVRKVGVSLPNPSDSPISSGAWPMRQTKAQSSPGVPSFCSLPKTTSSPWPTNTHWQFIQECCWPSEKRECNSSPVTPWSEKLWRACMCSALLSGGVREKGDTEEALPIYLEAQSTDHLGFSPQNEAQDDYESQRKLGLNCKALIVSYLLGVGWF